MNDKKLCLKIEKWLVVPIYKFDSYHFLTIQNAYVFQL